MTSTTGAKGFLYSPRASRSTPTVKNLTHLGFSASCRRSYRPPKTCRSSVFMEFVESVGRWDPYLNKLDPSVFDREFRPPTVRDFELHLERFGGSRPYDGVMVDRLLPEVVRILSRYEGLDPHSPYYSQWLTEENLMNIRISSGTNPGIRWTRLGYKTRGDALPYAIKDSMDKIRGCMSGNEYYVPPCVPSGRGKLVDINEGTEKKQGRLVLMPDLTRHLMGSLTSVPYSKLVKKMSKENGGVMVGMGPFNRWYDRLAKWVTEPRHPTFMATLDFSGFDQTVPAGILRAAMAYISRRFQFTQGSYEYWASETRNLVDTEIAMPDGEVYRKERGVASGDPWTSQVGSLSNWMMWTIYFKDMGIDGRAWTFGDDVLVAIYDSTPEEGFIKRVSDYFYTKFGMEVKQEVSFTTKQLVITGNYPVAGGSIEFLHNYFVRSHTMVVPVPLYESMFDGLLYPEKNPELVIDDFHCKDNYNYERQRVSAYYILYYYNIPARNTLERYHRWLSHRVTGGEITLDSDQLRRLLSVLDIPAEQFQKRWLERLPTGMEVTELYWSGTLTNYTPRTVQIDEGMDRELAVPNLSPVLGRLVQTLARFRMSHRLQDIVD